MGLIRMLKIAASYVLLLSDSSRTLPVRSGSSLSAALLVDHFEHPEVL